MNRVRSSPVASAGYSGRPLAAKLGIEAGTTVHVVGAPARYLEILSPLPPRATVSPRLSGSTRLVHLFATRKSDLARRLESFRKALPPDVPIWVSWPKKSAKVATDITEDVIRAIALPLGFVDIKVCAVTDVWSGLKLVVRRELR